MYCLNVGFDYTYIDINALTQEIKPLLGLEPMAPIRPQLLVSRTNHRDVRMNVCMYECMHD